MKTKEELEKLNDEQEMLEFFEKYHKTEVDMAKCKVLHALHDLKDGMENIFKKLTNGMTKKNLISIEADSISIVMRLLKI